MATGAASLGLHCLALALLTVLVAPSRLDPPIVRSIAVDLVSSVPEALPPRREREPAPDPLPSTAADPAAISPPPLPHEDQMIHASTFYAAGILADPANTEVRRNFGLLAGSEQLIQLCNMEALEQIRLADTDAAPDAVVGYAFDDLGVDGLTLTANGGAVRVAGQWFRVRYSCVAAADVRGTVAFEYAIGNAIPQDEWEAHNLNGDDEGLDR
ncbi:MAG: DUF930 domain-containing protein [Alphaproteobacteria bacterium]|nr:DUF930 domain-containing protein [Alphaproteobacteria bacterium]